MTNDTLTKFLSLPDTLKRRSIIQRNGYPFGIGWMDRTIRSFESDPKPLSITFAARINLECFWHDGFIEVDRDGNLRVMLEEQTA